MAQKVATAHSSSGNVNNNNDDDHTNNNNDDDDDDDGCNDGRNSAWRASFERECSRNAVDAPQRCAASNAQDANGTENANAGAATRVHV